MHLRRQTALTVTGLALACSALTSCGFNYATDRVNTPAAGVNDHAGSVDVLGGVIVSAQDNSGTFIASLANNDEDKKAVFESLAGGEGNTIQPQSFPPVTIDPGGLVNLAIDGGVPVSGTFTAGDFIPVTLTFDSGERATMQVPVVPDDGVYDGLDTSASASSSASPSASSSASPSGSSSASSSASSSTSPSATPSE
jgi:hypothetical protein